MAVVKGSDMVRRLALERDALVVDVDGTANSRAVDEDVIGYPPSSPSGPIEVIRCPSATAVAVPAALGDAGG